MPLRFRRSLKIAPGLRATVSKTGFGVSAGERGARVTAFAQLRGRRTTSVGIPGSGISNVCDFDGRCVTAQARGRSAQTAEVANAAAVLPKPGMFSGRIDKRYYEGVQAYFANDHNWALEAFADVLAGEPAGHPKRPSGVCAVRGCDGRRECPTDPPPRSRRHV